MDFITALKGDTGLGSSFADTLMKTSNFTPNLASNSGGFLKGLKNSFSNFGDWLFKSSDANKITHFDRLGNVLGGGGALYGAYNQQKMAKKNFDLQKDAYNFNKYLANEELNRRKNIENKLQNVWSD
ncbi:hypothetical protein RLQ69_001917 [Campylobacter jejuni]|uniref:Uncharacterized protein n=1 Tax=Campylobacter jejuni TaxID=197 RepID=A0A690V9X5_CAMJU|nr:hypothetical protein [Campylobacter jejuni]EAJ5194574.1 hypothetical protein [Campylobacter jejuni]EAK0574266.1 hypothetical protein [Campylobacter jejuni]EDP7703107.1 hypothetical protein [Campylobacter jejuni]EDP8235156.1 hypothetical protein [Campylobacter jejuni]EFV4333224.1 hypothetical protein [Campylobacter jejuni]